MHRQTDINEESCHRQTNHGLLVLYDAVLYLLSALVFFVFPQSGFKFGAFQSLCHVLMSFAMVLAFRFPLKVYKTIWRFGGVGSYLRLLAADMLAVFSYFIFSRLLYMMTGFPERLEFSRIVALIGTDFCLALGLRMSYRYFYKNLLPKKAWQPLVTKLFRLVGVADVVPEAEAAAPAQKINCAIYGTQRSAVVLAREMADNPSAVYFPMCFIDSRSGMDGRRLLNIPVYADDNRLLKRLEEANVQTMVLSSEMTKGERRKLNQRFTEEGFSVKLYDQPALSDVNGKPRTVSFHPEDLLFRKQLTVLDAATVDYYRGKRVMITGGGGSIGSELCRQIARMEPEKLIILDIAENGAYDIQQELKLDFGWDFPVCIEIASVVDKDALRRVFAEYKPQIVIHAAAHKHVPLMEKNCIEAVRNNVFGTKNVVDLCHEWNAEHFLMVSTDKAVNPTNIMGATKRLCEEITLSRAEGSETVFTATRFGNVLGSAGSVIPLFKRQIEAGGPVTVTDKRIVRYFMTIPEAAQLVLASGSMAKSGELFVLDMGEPVNIYDLARTMISLADLKPDVDIKIVETGLRPGEKLYEELLVKGENTRKTANERIFIEQEQLPRRAAVELKLQALLRASTVSDQAVRAALHEAVPTFRTPEEVNAEAGELGREQK